jgi:DNA mismatch repair protein MutL
MSRAETTSGLWNGQDALLQEVLPPDERPPVQLLSPQLINRIAAGEVVERPASVVKELVENALDAGATQIAVSVGAGGRTIRVADNGHGMRREDAAMAFYNHATSKIREAADLDRIETLGFRGEALASVAAISRMTCLTRTAEAEIGVKVTLDERGEPVLGDTGCAPGTIMEVDDLFYNTPARLKFLKRPQTEMGHIEETVQFLALSHPEVRFSLSMNGKETLATSGAASGPGNVLKRTLEELFPLQRENIRLVPVAVREEAGGEEGALSLAGFTSEPGAMKSSKRWIMTFVNGRHVRCAVLQKAVEAAYESLLPHGRYPLCALFLRLPPRDVDVNVHPTKREVRYAASNRVFGFVKAGLRQALAEHGFALAPSTPFPASPWEVPAGSADVLERDVVPISRSLHPPAKEYHTLPPATPSVQAALDLYRPMNDAGPELFMKTEHSLAENPPPKVMETAAEPETPSTRERFKVIGQLFNTYILLETIQGLLVVDQHIASERTFFEALTLNLTGDTPLIQRLLTSRPIAIRPVQRDLLARHQADFARLGFLYSLDEAGTLSEEERLTVRLEGYPLVYDGRDGLSGSAGSGGLFENLLAQLEETGEMKLDLDPLIATLACHSAVRAGDPLTPEEMHTVISRWLACRLPWTCPHGRPIAHTISTTDLNRFFHRGSLPVNAHST